jgi:hypothetical protein
VGRWRSTWRRPPWSSTPSDLVGELSTRSEEFRRYWARHDVRFHFTGVKRLHHPQVGDMELRYEGLEVVFDTDLTIYAYTADPGTRSAEALRPARDPGRNRRRRETEPGALTLGDSYRSALARPPARLRCMTTATDAPIEPGG